MKIGLYDLPGKVFLAPMAGITDYPFRRLCRQFGAGWVVGEMMTSSVSLRNSRKSQFRKATLSEASPRTVQLVGNDPETMAESARYNVAQGASIIDINMGCPAKKVCKQYAGSALLSDQKLVGKILDRVVNSVDVPVTLKIRTGIDTEHKNGVEIACLAEESGIQSLAIHGRTRACKFKGKAEYETIRQIKKAVNIPVIANGDITSAEMAKRVLQFTEADAVMIGRSTQGRPWLISQMNYFLDTGRRCTAPSIAAQQEIVLSHLEEIFSYYGVVLGVKIARKHIKWYTQTFPVDEVFKRKVYTEESTQIQFNLVNQFYTNLMNEQQAA